MQYMVCGLSVCACVSFFMMFVISMALIENLHDQIKVFTPMTMENYTTWGVIPGHLNYNYTKELYLFDINNVTD